MYRVSAGWAGCRDVGLDDLEDAPVLLAVGVVHPYLDNTESDNGYSS
jgi:hypothetical protein